MLQISSSGGTYPVETTPGLFQALHPFMPASYVVNSLRQHIGGGIDERFWGSLIVILGVLIGSLEAGQALGLKPRAKILGGASIGSEPSLMLTGPEYVTRKLLGKLGMTPDDIDVWELNEAFAAVVLRYMQALDIPHDKINVNGGGISMGHPLGATGAMITGIALDELERSDKSTALITLCIGGGMGTATVIERV